MLFKNNGEALVFLLAVFWYISIPAGCALIYFGIRWMKHAHFLGLKIAALLLPIIGLVLIWAGAPGLTQMIKDKSEDHRLASVKVFQPSTAVGKHICHLTRKLTACLWQKARCS